MNIFETIQSRYSCRAYQDKPVETDKLNTLLEAARLAPSARNIQDWRFVIVTSNQTRKALQTAANLKSKIMVIDLAELGFISSTGLGGIVAAHVTCQKNGTKMFLVNPKPMVREVLEVTRLTTLFKICDTLEEAEQLAAG